MIQKLPKWVWIGGWLLALVAGMINVVGLLGFEHQPVSHLTATISRLGVATIANDRATLAMLLAVVGSFLLGAMISGGLIRTSALQLGRHYGTVLFLETFLLCGAVVLLERHNMIGVCMLCCACGLQNAMASTYSGAIIRTTHMTGIFTDFGILCGQLLGGLKIDWRRLILCVSIISGFFCGGLFATIIYPRLAYKTLLIPAAITGSAALSYGFFSIWRRNRFVKAA